MASTGSLTAKCCRERVCRPRMELARTAGRYCNPSAGMTGAPPGRQPPTPGCRHTSIPSPNPRIPPQRISGRLEPRRREEAQICRQNQAGRDDIHVRLPAVFYLVTEGWSAAPFNGADMLVVESLVGGKQPVPTSLRYPPLSWLMYTPWEWYTAEET